MTGENDIGKVSFGVEANFDPKGLKDAERGLSNLTQAGATAEKGLGKFGDAVSVAGGVLAADLVKGLLNAAVKVATFASAVTESSSAIVESFEHVAQATGLTIRQLQELEPAMRKEGISAEQMGATFRILARNIAEAKDPSSQAGKAFDQLGIALTGLESPADVLTILADRVSRMPDGFEKARLVTELLGRSGSQLIPVLNQGADGFIRSANAARQMANVLSDEANKALLEVNDSFDMVEVAQDNLSKHLGVLFAPIVQSYNEAKIGALQKFTEWIDETIIASRTLAIRLEALFGFLRAQAQLSLSELGKVPEFFERWDKWAEEQIAATRKQSITVDALSSSIGNADAHVQAFNLNQQKSWDRSSMALMQLDMGWKIVQASIDAYGHSQEALGRYITTKLIAAYNELKMASALWAKSDFDATNRSIEQMKAMEAQVRATAAATNQSALAGGRISPVEFEQRSGDLAIAAIDNEIAAQRQRLTAINTFYGQKITLAEHDANAQRELIQQQLAETQTVNNSLALLEQQRVTQAVVNAGTIAKANMTAEQNTLAARASVAQAEVAILQGKFASVSELRAAQLRAIEANAQRELAVVGLTEEQKLAIQKNAEAQRVNISRQFPTFWEKQMQDLQASNVFAVGQLISTWSNGMASTIVNAQNFGQAMIGLGKQTATALLQGLIQLAIQQLTIENAKNVGIVASNAAAAGTTLAIWEGAGAALLGTFATISGAISGLMTGTIMPMLIKAGTAVVTFLSSVASALDATIFGIPYSVAVWAAAGLVAAAIGVIAAFAFAKGGIVTEPTLGMIGEAGSSEAVIPLNSQGAGFMADMLGLGGQRGQSGPTTIIIEWDGRQMMRYVADNIPSVLRLKGLSPT